jgi:ribosomal protein S18 acetylase RimI-like enzyme
MNRETIVQPADPADAVEIYTLIVRAFEESSLRFSVYQTSRAIAHIREEIEFGLAEGSPRFAIVRKARRVHGFYNARRVGEEYFLVHVAVDPDGRRGGAGRRLLLHFEETARRAGCRRSALSVFESNRVAYHWYRRLGYTPTDKLTLLRFPLRTLERRPDARLEFSQEDLRIALREERQRGFSALQLRCGETNVKLGLIGGTVCNLMEPHGAAAEASGRAVASMFHGEREWLLMRTTESLTIAREAETTEDSWRMVKDVDPEIVSRTVQDF